MKTKTEIQDLALEKFESNPFIILEWSTGIGKSLAAIKMIEKSKESWNIVLAETNHETNWINEFKKHGKENLLERITFFCYASLHKHLSDDNYILDELHHGFSELRQQHIKEINFKKFIGLSATLSKKQKDIIKELFPKCTTFKISISEAIEWELLPEPTVYFVGVELDNKSKLHKYNFTKDKSIMCTEQEMYNRISERIEYFKRKYFESNVEFDKIKWLRTANDRKKFLANCKTIYARMLLEHLSSKRLICFTNSINQSEILSKGLSIHSKISKKDREALIQSFNDGDIDKIFATGMLKEGMNLENIEAGIIIQLDNVERYFAQIHGRTLRSLYPEQYVLYVKNTQDETYVQTALENFNKDYVKFITINDV